MFIDVRNGAGALLIRASFRISPRVLSPEGWGSLRGLYLHVTRGGCFGEFCLVLNPMAD